MLASKNGFRRLLWVRTQFRLEIQSPATSVVTHTTFNNNGNPTYLQRFTLPWSYSRVLRKRSAHVRITQVCVTVDWHEACRYGGHSRCVWFSGLGVGRKASNCYRREWSCQEPWPRTLNWGGMFTAIWGSADDLVIDWRRIKLLGIGWKSVGRIQLAQEKMTDFANTELKLRVRKIRQIACLAEELSDCQQALCSMQTVYCFRPYESMLTKQRQSNPITGLDRLWWLQEAEAPRFQDNQHVKVLSLSVLRTGRLYPPGNISGTHFC